MPEQDRPTAEELKAPKPDEPPEAETSSKGGEDSKPEPTEAAGPTKPADPEPARPAEPEPRLAPAPSKATPGPRARSPELVSSQTLPAIGKAQQRPPRTMTQYFRLVVDKVAAHHGDAAHARRRIAYPLYAARVLLQVIRQWARDRCPQQAASLAFQTALSLVPLIAVGLALLRSSGGFGAESTLVQFLARQVLPVSRDEIARYLLNWAGHLSFETAGIAGIGTTVLLSFFLYTTLERIFNDIWRVERRRSLGQRFVVFYAVVTLVPMLLGTSLYQMARFGVTEGFLGHLTALAGTWGALFCAYKLLPATHVRWAPAAAAALFAALGFEISKNLFRLYVSRVAFASYAGVYGTLGLVPITLIWMYYTWLGVLFGAELTHTMQNLRHLERRSRLGDVFTHVNGRVAARLLSHVVHAWRRGDAPPPRAALAARYDLDEEVVERIFSRLVQARIVVDVDGGEGGYLPARPLRSVTLAEVLALFRGNDAQQARPPGSPPPAQTALDVALAEVDAATRERAVRTTLEDI